VTKIGRDRDNAASGKHVLEVLEVLEVMKVGSE
jgi:hypothetical protein